MTFTPPQGVSTVVKRFLHERSADRFKVVTRGRPDGHADADADRQGLNLSAPKRPGRGIPALPSQGRDDLISATRDAMMLRFASTKAAYDKFRAPICYP